MVGTALVGCFLSTNLKLGKEIDASVTDFKLPRLHLLLVRPVFDAV